MPTHDGLSGPHLAAAFLCEKVLTERDGVSSFVRVVERFTIPTAPQLPPGVELPPGMKFAPSSIQFNLVVMLKSGSLGMGKFTMKITLVKPNGSEMESQGFQVFFNGGEENGVAVISPIVIPAPEEGLHWFDVYFEQSLITRIPLRVFYQPIQMAPLPPTR